jgi:hypothetical protein
MSIRDLIEYERWDPAWLRVAHTLPTTDSEKFVALTEIMEVRNARRSKKRANDAPLRYFEVNDTDIRTGEVKSVHSAPGPELAKKGRIRNQVRSGDILLPNHRDSLMAAGANNGRPVVVVDASLDGVLTTDRFMVVRPKIDPLLLVAILNSRGVRRQLIAQCRGAASLDVRERMLGNVLVPRSLLEEPLASAVPQLAHRVTESRRELDENVRELEVSVDAEFECDLPIRPPAAK